MFANAVRYSFLNPVGYQNVGTRTDNQLSIPTFVNVGKTDKVMLTDISVTGFEGIPEWAEGWGGLYITKIDSAGYTMNNDTKFGEDTIRWDFSYEPDEEGNMVKKWYDGWSGDEITIENNREIEAGEGLYVSCPAPEYGEVIKLVYAGAVMGDDNSYLLVPDNSLIGNPMPTDVSLTDVDVTGFEGIPEWAEGWGGLYITKIDSAGYTMNNDTKFGEDTIRWDFSYEPDEEGNMVKKWYDGWSGDEITVENDRSILAGEGLVVNCPAPEYGEQIAIIFPSPLVDHTEK